MARAFAIAMSFAMLATICALTWQKPHADRQRPHYLAAHNLEVLRNATGESIFVTLALELTEEDAEMLDLFEDQAFDFIHDYCFQDAHEKPRLLRGMIPSELQFGCCRFPNYTEANFSKVLATGSPVEQRAAAQQLWRGRSRYYAADVLKYLEQNRADPLSLEFRREVSRELSPQYLAQELKHGNLEWAAWLAGLRPQPDLVPCLIEALQVTSQRKNNLEFEQRAAILHALGKSRDERAFEPLLNVLQSTDRADQICRGFAAQALGHLGRLEAEAPLIEALTKNDCWLEVHACIALGQIGTSNALPQLINLTDPERYTGALGVRRCALQAIEQIEAREP